jgi:predicted nucleic acid-binding protein
VVSRKPPRRRPSRAAPAPRTGVGANSVHYIESSALVAALLEHDMAGMDSAARYVTSALTIAEAGRAIIRARAARRLTEGREQAAVRALRTFEHRCFLVNVDHAVLERVRRPFPVEPIRTLDAVHLASVELLGEPPPLVTVVTRDARVRDNARALGYVLA